MFPNARSTSFRSSAEVSAAAAMVSRKSEFQSIVFITVGFLFMRLVLATLIDAGFDEAVYYAYSLRPALSYFDHPPMVAWLAGLVPRLTGIVTPLTIRLPFILLFSATGICLYFLSRRWLNRQDAKFALVLFNSVPLLFICGGFFVLPDGGLTFFWTTALVGLAKILFDHDRHLRTSILAGVLIGMTMLSKYHGIFLIVFFAVYLIMEQPRLLGTPRTYLIFLFAGLTFLPVIVWNIQHRFASFAFQGQRAFGRGLSPDYFFQAVAGQAGYLTPMVFVPMAYVIWQTITRGLVRDDGEYRFYFFFGSLPVLFFMGVSLFKPILPHWTLPGYIVLIIPLARLIADGYRRKVWVKRTVIGSSVFIAIFLIVAVAQIRLGVLHLEKWVERGWISAANFSEEPTLDMVGWGEVDRYLTSNHISPEANFLFTPKFLISGKVDLATKGRYTVMCFNKRSSAYAVWDSQVDMRGKDAIYICTDRYFKDPYKAYSKYFESISEPYIVPVMRGGVLSKKFYFYRCRNLVRRYPTPFTIQP